MSTPRDHLKKASSLKNLHEAESERKLQRHEGHSTNLLGEAGEDGAAAETVDHKGSLHRDKHTERHLESPAAGKKPQLKKQHHQLEMQFIGMGEDEAAREKYGEGVGDLLAMLAEQSRNLKPVADSSEEAKSSDPNAPFDMANAPPSIQQAAEKGEWLKRTIPQGTILMRFTDSADLGHWYMSKDEFDLVRELMLAKKMQADLKNLGVGLVDAVYKKFEELSQQNKVLIRADLLKKDNQDITMESLFRPFLAVLKKWGSLKYLMMVEVTESIPDVPVSKVAEQKEDTGERWHGGATQIYLPKIETEKMKVKLLIPTHQIDRESQKKHLVLGMFEKRYQDKFSPDEYEKLQRRSKVLGYWSRLKASLSFMFSKKVHKNDAADAQSVDKNKKNTKINNP